VEKERLSWITQANLNISTKVLVNERGSQRRESEWCQVRWTACADLEVGRGLAPGMWAASPNWRGKRSLSFLQKGTQPRQCLILASRTCQCQTSKLQTYFLMSFSTSTWGKNYMMSLLQMRSLRIWDFKLFKYTEPVSESHLGLGVSVWCHLSSFLCTPQHLSLPRTKTSLEVLGTMSLSLRAANEFVSLFLY
jgi:hypothetical protein